MHNVKCKNCKQDEYCVLNTEVCEDNPRHKSAIALCYNCRNLVDIIWDRTTFSIVKIKDLGFLEEDENE